MKAILSLLFAATLLVSCKNQAAEEQTEAPAEQEEVAAEKYTLTPFEASKAFNDAAIRAMSYKNGTFSTVISGSSYQLGEQTPDAGSKNCANSAEGQHLHLIVDDQPYAAKYESSFTYEIPDGEHYLLCFLSRSYHESIKTPDAHMAVKVNIENKSVKESVDIEDPMLFYSRPKGLYTGDDTKKVMLDFYLVNADLGNYKVEADINGEKHLIDVWQPYYIEGLPEGDNTITLSLLNNNGSLVEAPFNPVSRTFKIEKTPAAN